MKYLLALPLLLTSLPAQADYYVPGGSQYTACYETVYREEYIPGTRNNPGQIKRYNEEIEVPCGSQRHYTTRDTNSCIGGTIIGGLLGGGIGGEGVVLRLMLYRCLLLLWWLLSSLLLVLFLSSCCRSRCY